jgi:sulfate adenylyltransferase (ADP) / ATP adenylyltransferase
MLGLVNLFAQDLSSGRSVFTGMADVVEPQSSKSQFPVLLPQGSLWSQILTQTEHALGCGALQSIPTDYELVPEAGANFLVRMVTNLVRKQAAKTLQKQRTQELGQDFNPFLPHEPDLFVADLTPTHLGLLNKFNVVDHHLLIITRAFESQDTLLTPADFAALWLCLGEYPSLGFYNGGTLAGASQRHKHLQVVPLPLLPEGDGLPIAPLIAQATWHEDYGKIPAFPFRHGLARLDPAWSVEQAAPLLQGHYLALMGQLMGKWHKAQNSAGDSPIPYNLLVTREWMLLVPRSQEKAQLGSPTAEMKMSINALGFAGALLVKNPAQLQALKAQRPLSLLAQVGVPLPPV